jgi:hypothetical protein
MSKKSLSAAKAAQAANIAAASSETDSSYEEIYLTDEMLATIANIKVFTFNGFKRLVVNFNNGRNPEWGFVEQDVPFGHFIPKTCKFGKEIRSGELKLTLLEGKVIKATKGSF